MKSHMRTVMVGLMVIGLGVAVAALPGCGENKDKMSKEKMEKDKMKDDKMEKDKMKDDKMKDDKMKDDKMKDDKMKDDKMKDDKMKDDKMKDDKKSSSLWRPWTGEQPQLASSRLHFGSRVYGV